MQTNNFARTIRQSIVGTVIFLTLSPVLLGVSPKSCAPFATDFLTPTTTKDPGLALCKPDNKHAVVKPRSELVLDMSSDNPIVDDSGYDFFFYESKTKDGIELDPISIAVAVDDGSGHPGIFKQVFVWGDQIHSNNGNIPDTHWLNGIEMPNEKIPSSDLYQNAAIAIDIGVNDSQAYRFVQILSYSGDDDSEKYAQVDAIEAARRDDTDRTATPTTSIVPSPSATPMPPTATATTNVPITPTSSTPVAQTPTFEEQTPTPSTPVVQTPTFEEQTPTPTIATPTIDERTPSATSTINPTQTPTDSVPTPPPPTPTPPTPTDSVPTPTPTLSSPTPTPTLPTPTPTPPTPTERVPTPTPPPSTPTDSVPTPTPPPSTPTKRVPTPTPPPPSTPTDTAAPTATSQSASTPTTPLPRTPSPTYKPVLPTAQPPLSASSVATATQRPAATPTAPTPYQPTRGTAIPSVSVPGSESAAPTPTGATLPSASPTPTPGGSSLLPGDIRNVILSIIASVILFLISWATRKHIFQGAFITNLALTSFIVLGSTFCFSLALFIQSTRYIYGAMFFISLFITILQNIWRWYGLIWINRVLLSDLILLPELINASRVAEKIIELRQKHNNIFGDFACLDVVEK
jgi:hypothetical protein